MIRLPLALTAAAALALAPQVASAAPKPAKPETLKKGPIAINPAMGYVLVRLGPKAPEGGKPDAISLTQADAATGRPYAKAKFAADKYLARTASALVQPGRSFLDAAGAGTHIVMLYPGRWFVAAAGNTCMSMGSYAFDVKPGEITDIGTVMVGREDGKSPVPEIAKNKLSQDLVEFGTLMNIVMSHSLTMRAAVDGDPIPDEAKALPIRRAALIEDYRFDNSCQSLIGRAASLPPIERQPPLAKIPDEVLAKR